MQADQPPFLPTAQPPAIHVMAPPAHGTHSLSLKSHGYHYLVTGNTLLPSSILRQAIEKSADPQKAVGAINNAFHAAGYFLVAVKAEVQGKSIHVEVVQGQISEEHIAPGLGWFYTGLRDQNDLTVNDITYRSVLADAYATRNGQRMQAGFSPAATPGGSAFTIATSPIPSYSPVSGTLLFGNYGSRYASRYLAGANVALHPGKGVELNANYMAGLPGLSSASSGSQYYVGGVGFNTITPWGVYGFNTQWTHYRIGEAAAPLYPTGNIFTWSATGSQLLYASAKSRWNINEGYTHVDNVVTVFAGSYTLTDQHYDYYSVGTQYSRAITFLGQGGSVSGAFTYNQGISGRRGTLITDAPGAPSPQFHYFDTSLSYQQSLPLGMTLSLNASGQGAFDTLPQQQQWVLGGFGSLSAWYPGVLTGDSGYTGRMLLQSPAYHHYGFTLNGNLFAEVGGVTTTYLAPHSNPWQSLSDVGIGVNLQSRWGTTLSVMSAIPVGWNNVSAPLRSSDRVVAYFVLQQSF